MISKLHRFIFIIPLIFSGILIYKYLSASRSIFKLKTIEEIQKNIKRKGIGRSIKIYSQNIIDFLGKYTSPPQKSKLFRFYRKFLRFTRFSVNRYFAIKTVIIITFTILLFLIKFTNIAIYTDEIINSYEYKIDLIYEQDDRLVDKQKALEEERYFLYEAAKVVTSGEVRDESLKEQVMQKILGVITSKNIEAELPSYTVANKVYYRLQDYYSVRSINYRLYLSIFVLVYFLFDGAIFIFNIFAKANAKIELRFLKKLIILNGNFKDMEFTELLSLLISKSKYYKKILQEIEGVNNKNTVENEMVYREVLSSIKDENAKLFFEKLEQANNSNFIHAIRNIEEEEILAQEERKTKVSARVESIHSFGVIGAFIIIYLLANYLLIPWLQAHDISAYY